MPFYYLHDKQIIPKSEKDFKYIFYTQNKILDFTNTITFPEDKDIEYCPHEIICKYIQISPINDDIDIIGNEKTIKAKFIKISNHSNFELWLNNNINDRKN
jgi:hypothetical protein